MKKRCTMLVLWTLEISNEQMKMKMELLVDEKSDSIELSSIGLDL